uniref:PPUP8568 n=1 Tax=Poeciliopsis prolifica TaxID=188132 RepID=A0A0S7ES66_9TELE
MLTENKLTENLLTGAVSQRLTCDPDHGPLRRIQNVPRGRPGPLHALVLLQVPGQRVARQRAAAAGGSSRWRCPPTRLGPEAVAAPPRRSPCSGSTHGGSKVTVTAGHMTRS